MTINKILYDDALQLIFKHLSFEQKFACRLVCRRWKRVIEDLTGNQQVLCFYDHDEVTLCASRCRQHDFDFNTVIRGRTKNKRIVKQIVSTPGHLNSILSLLPNLRSVYLTIDTFQSIQQFQAMFQLCPNIECLTVLFNLNYISDLRVRQQIALFAEASVLFESKLKHINFDMPFYPVKPEYQEMVTNLVETMPRIVKLTINANVCSNSYNLMFDVVTKSNSLRQLDLGQLSVNECVRIVEGLGDSKPEAITHLNLNIADAPFVSGGEDKLRELFRRIDKLTGLVHLEIKISVISGRRTKRSFADRSYFPNLNQLRVVSFIS